VTHLLHHITSYRTNQIIKVVGREAGIHFYVLGQPEGQVVRALRIVGDGFVLRQTVQVLFAELRQETTVV